MRSLPDSQPGKLCLLCTEGCLVYAGHEKICVRLHGCRHTLSFEKVTAASLCVVGTGPEQRSQAVPGPDAEALVLPRPGDGTAGTLQRSASAGDPVLLATYIP